MATRKLIEDFEVYKHSKIPFFVLTSFVVAPHVPWEKLILLRVSNSEPVRAVRCYLSCQCLMGTLFSGSKETKAQTE